MARLAVQREDRRLPDEARSQGGLLRSQSGRWGRQDRPSVKGGLLEVWRDTRQLVLAAQVAAIYAAVLIPFKVGIPIIPGFVELRPANAIPVVASLLFGPAAAWGAAFGNLIGDLFGTLGPGSLFGLLGKTCGSAAQSRSKPSRRPMDRALRFATCALPTEARRARPCMASRCPSRPAP